MEWSIRSLLSPVITRILIYGVNPIDLEFVLNAVEKKPHMNSKSLEQSWRTEWDSKAQKYLEWAKKAEQHQQMQSAFQLYMFATKCYYAISLINFSDINDKKSVYLQYMELYRKSLEFAPFHTERLRIPLNDGNEIAGYLHLPPRNVELSSPASSPCIVIYSGLGSSKEEMLTLAYPLIERGAAVLIADMPGNGESIFAGDVTCSYPRLQSAFTAIPDVLEARTEIKDDGIGVYGLCMGGGYAHHAAAIDSRYRACVTFFPLFITQVPEASTPRWMRKGDGIRQQIGKRATTSFLEEMKQLEEGALSCPFLFIHGTHDNWMTLDAATSLYDRASGPKKKIIVDETPVFSNKEAVTHTMPVGEQLHWLRHVAADWILNIL